MQQGNAGFGSRTANDLPVDSHELIALCAPRLTFISHGIPSQGDANWLDHQGSYMATIAAGSVFKLLGVKDLGFTNDYKTEKMPAVNVSILDGQLAWRQHDGGHTDGPTSSILLAGPISSLAIQPPAVSSSTLQILYMDQFSLKDKVIVVTGGTGILGEAFVNGIAGAGGTAVILGRKLEVAQLRAKNIIDAGGRALAIQADVLKKEENIAARDNILVEFGKIDGLVNAAGGNMPGE
jgi:hypothetical protein